MSLTDEIYTELADGLKTGLDWPHFLAKHSASKGPLYNALGRLFHDMGSKVQELNEVQAKLDAAGLKLDELHRQIKEAESSLASLEERKSALDEQTKNLESMLAEKSEVIKQVGELGKLGFDAERLRQLRDALTEIGAKHGLKGKEAVSKFFNDIKDYEAVLEAKTLLEGLQTQIETKKLEAENWQAKEEALRRRHDDLKDVVGAVHALRTRGIKAGQIITWHQILSQFESIEHFEESLRQYGDITKLVNKRREEAESYELRLTKDQSQVETLEKEKGKIEAAIDALKVAGVKEIKTMTEAAEKQLKAVTASGIKEAQGVAQGIGSEFATFLTQLDRLTEKAVHLGEELERSKQELQKYEGVKNALESHAVASERQK